MARLDEIFDINHGRPLQKGEAAGSILFLVKQEDRKEKLCSKQL